VSPIVGVHGIGNYRYFSREGSVGAASDAVSARWTGALRDGLAASGTSPGAGPDVRVAFYAHLLYRGTPQGADDPAFLEDAEQELLIDWVDQLVPVGVPQGPRTARARAAGDWLVGHLGEQALAVALTFVREVSAYLRNDLRRQNARDAVAEAIIRDKPRVVIAHSLGTVVAYETLWEHPELSIDLLLTLGSPLAMPGVIFDRLDPRPADERGRRPPGVAAWANLADVGDIVAIPRTGLAPRFDGVTHDNPAVVIGENAFHAVTGYLAARETSAALAPYLTDPDHSRHLG
jgi:hypothetical protein